jgi:hypothetical protein
MLSAISLEQLKQLPPLDAILFLVDISRTLNKYEKKALRSFFFELKDNMKDVLLLLALILMN